MKNAQKTKRNNIFQNAFIIYKAMFKRYPTAIPLVIVYIIISVALPFVNTLIPAMAIKGITSRSVKIFLEYIGIAVGIMCVFSGIKMFCEKKMQMKHTYTRISVFMMNFIKKAINTDYLNIEPQPKQKIMGKGVQGVSGNYEGAEEVSTLSIHLVTIVLGIFSYGTVIFVLDWRILAITLGMFVADVLIRNHAVKYGDDHRESFSEPWRKMNYYERNSMNISAGKDIRIFGLKKLFDYHFDKMINTYKKFRYHYQLKWYYPTISDTAFNVTRDWLAYTLLIHKVLTGQIDAATFTVYLGIIASFSQYIYDVSMHFANLRDASHQFNDYHAFMEQKDVFEHKNVISEKDCRVKPDNDTMPSDNDTMPSDNDSSVIPVLDTGISAPSIEFRNVSFTYEGSEKPVLTNVSFKINADEKIALVGNNGAGKTTIVKLLCGLYPPTSGEILIDGKSINDIGVEKYQDMISVLFQDTSPIALSIAENVCGCEPKDVDRKKLHDCLEKAGLLEKVNTLTKKEETYITQTLDEKGVVLSGGETQKLLLAKAMYKDGPMLILDEPTSALDPIAESRIYEEYNQLADKKTAVFISHRLASTKFCDRILFLDNGQIVEEGSHDQLMKNGGKYREIFDIQSHYYKEEVSNEE
ncbi:MAG: ABC transporter ATP-binding protein [Treponema sp.]|nr:ABC transporter ATP-binding protein [Treponema sp.]